MINPAEFKFAAEDVTICLAAAGAGKTTAVVNRITELLAVYRPDEIAFATFTRKGVANGIERTLQANPGLTAADLPYFKTLHALCFQELGLSHKAILQQRHMEVFNAAITNEQDKHRVYLRQPFEQQTNDDRLLSRYDAERSGVFDPLRMTDPKTEERYFRFVKHYETFKQKNGLIDFHDCLARFKAAGRPVGVKAAFIDEAQDLTVLQWEVCRTAFARCEKIMICGDDYQTLFSYQGAKPEILISLAKRYPLVKLERSYRLPMEVYRLARGIVTMIGKKVEKDFVPAKDVPGFVEDIHDRDRLTRLIHLDVKKNGCPPGRWYLLFRNNCFMAETIRELERQVIPYHTSKGFFIPSRELKRIRRYYNYRKLGCGSEDAKQRFKEKYGVKDFNDDFIESTIIPSERRLVVLEYIDRYGLDALEEMAEKEPFLLLSTTHRVKGGEADYVAVFMDCTRRVALNELYNADEELRVLYVACTRSRLGLYVVQSFGYKHGMDKVMSVVKELSA
jgi:superfamily I DNA/RNA helicase